MNEQKAPISECPHCESKFGYYEKIQISGRSRWYHKFDGKEADNTDVYQDTKFKYSKYTYCADCDKRLFKSEEIGG
ncbi:hypothetical protein [Listeria booriae]|uniref:hypothetical protein n=1 Tax=Listeria booriae TaxID=1552123 RepID=UPI00162589BE|nr:hypothetical protein [Listeria booriae]